MSSLLYKKLDIIFPKNLMKTVQSVISIIKRLPHNHIFSYEDLNLKSSNKEAVIKYLNRLTQSGKIKKISKGKFYKPNDSKFGCLKPPQEQIVKDLLEKKGKITGYLTGFSAYNELGLTTQISSVITIGKNDIRPKLKRGIYNIHFVKQKNKITRKNIYLLKILDSIRNIKKIPDSSINKSSQRFLWIIKSLDCNELESLIKLAFKYTPATRALLGALVETSGVKVRNLDDLRKSLNPISTYQLTVSKKILPKAKNWNIK